MTNWEKYLYKPISDWPSFQIIWDKKEENFRHAFDNWDQDYFEIKFPNSLIIGRADLEEIDSNLDRQSQRFNNEIWEIGSPGAIAKCIEHWVKEKKMTPPMIEWSAKEKKLKITGGHHRTAVCRAINEEKILFLTPPSYKNNIDGLLTSVEWI